MFGAIGLLMVIQISRREKLQPTLLSSRDLRAWSLLNLSSWLFSVFRTGSNSSIDGFSTVARNSFPVPGICSLRMTGPDTERLFLLQSVVRHPTHPYIPIANEGPCFGIFWVERFLSFYTEVRVCLNKVGLGKDIQFRDAFALFATGPEFFFKNTNHRSEEELNLTTVELVSL